MDLPYFAYSQVTAKSVVIQYRDRTSTSQTRRHHDNIVLPIGSLTPLDEPNFVETCIHCFAFHAQAKKLKDHKVAGG